MTTLPQSLCLFQSQSFVVPVTFQAADNHSRAPKMSKKGEVQPLIKFSTLKGFRAMSVDGKIETVLFLEAAKEIVTQIGECKLYVSLYEVLQKIDGRRR